MKGELIDPDAERRVPARDVLSALLEAVAPHAQALGCEAELAPVAEMAECTGARRQLAFAQQGNGLAGLVGELAERFCLEGYAGFDASPSPFASAGAGRSG